MERQERVAVLPETIILAIICLLDAASTLYLVRTGAAREFNPLLGPSLEHSNLAFLALKSASFLVPLTILERLRSKHPLLVRRALRMAVGGYVALYLLGSFGLWLGR